VIKASCLCGAVSIQIEGSLRNARYCHCVNCRKFSGTAYAAWGLAQTSQLTISPSEPNVTKFNSGGGLRVFCAACGSPLWYEPTGLPQFRGIPLGAIDDGELAKPEMHVWTKSQVPWASISDALPRHEKHPSVQL
jgi:hypothetical protein